VVSINYRCTERHAYPAAALDAARGRQSTLPNLVVAMHTPFDMRRLDTDWVAKNDPFNAECLKRLGRCELTDYNRTAESQRIVALASPIDIVHERGPPLKLIYYDARGRPSGTMPRYVNDPHSVWYGVQMAEELERHASDFELTILSEDDWALEASSVLDFVFRRFSLS
jgi:hypothetical protein